MWSRDGRNMCECAWWGIHRLSVVATPVKFVDGMGHLIWRLIIIFCLRLFQLALYNIIHKMTSCPGVPHAPTTLEPLPSCQCFPWLDPNPIDLMWGFVIPLNTSTLLHGGHCGSYVNKCTLWIKLAIGKREWHCFWQFLKKKGGNLSCRNWHIMSHFTVQFPYLSLSLQQAVHIPHQVQASHPQGRFTCHNKSDKISSLHVDAWLFIVHLITNSNRTNIFEVCGNTDSVWDYEDVLMCEWWVVVVA